MAKGICQVVCKVLILSVYKVKDKGKSQAGGLETECRSRGPNQDKSLVFAIVIFSVICFLYVQVHLFLYTNILVSVDSYILDPQLASSRDQQLWFGFMPCPSCVKVIVFWHCALPLV